MELRGFGMKNDVTEADTFNTLSQARYILQKVLKNLLYLQTQLFLLSRHSLSGFFPEMLERKLEHLVGGGLFL
jgi:hypothetical protein